MRCNQSLCALATVLTLVLVNPGYNRAAVSPAEARAIAKDAYIYGFPIVDGYRIQYTFFQDRGNAEFKAPWNHIHNEPDVFTSANRVVQTPNADTPYSALGADLRAEPLVLSVPPIDKGRYFSVAVIDAYTFAVDFIGTRATGNGGGAFLLAGPHWKGEKPRGIDGVITCETEFAFVLYRTQLFSPDDIKNVNRIQDGYKVQTLSAFLGEPAPAAAPAIDFIKPLSPEEQRTSPQFFAVLNFVLRFCPTHPSEKELMARFAKLGIGRGGGGGASFDFEKLPPETRQAVRDGMADAWKELAELQRTQIDTGKVTSADLFGTRAFLKDNYLFRMAGAVLGIYGLPKEEAIYPAYFTDADGEQLSGAKQYVMRFAPGQLPPVDAFWSVTMYELPDRFFVPNPINRYLINSPMLPQLKRDGDGGLTLYVQHESPGESRQSNWLPAPKGGFFLVMRLYLPREAALDGTWKHPPLRPRPNDTP